MKEIKSRTYEIWRKIRSSTATVIRTCFACARMETIAMAVLSVFGSLALAFASWFNAKVIAQATSVISSGEHGMTSDKTIGGIIDYLWNNGLLTVAFALAALISLEAAIKLLTFLFTTNLNPKVRQCVDGLVREQRLKLDIGKLRSAEYEEIKLRITEQPFSWDAIRQYAVVLTMLCTHLCGLVIFGVGLLFFNPAYAVIIILAVMVRAVSEFYWNNKWWGFSDSESLYSRRKGVFVSLFSNIVSLFEMSFYGKGAVVQDIIRKAEANSFKRKNVLVKKDFFWSMITELVTAIALTAIIIHAIYTSLVAGNIMLLVLTLDFSRRFISHLKDMLFNLSAAWRGVRSVSVITDEFLALKPLIEQKGSAVPEGFRRIHLNDVRFSYPQSKDGVKALKGVSLTIPVGSKVALVGPSGGGKSTLASLLARQYDPTSGSISLDTMPLTKVHPAEWAKHTLCMGQDYSIPHVSVLEALTYGLWESGDIESATATQYDIYLGADKIDMNLVEHACRRAYILKEILEKPDGWNALIGSEQGKDGTDFSKGQKQRLALAARMLAERRLMIYDEPDAALDAIAKQEVIKGIVDTDATVIMVLHNLQACQHCDFVVFIEDGRIVETGSHEELLAQNGKYAEMYHAAMNTSAGKEHAPHTEPKTLISTASNPQSGNMALATA